ncbi:MAG: helix-turn-helix domain-containing protein [Alicyclobacillus sp.]|nr:helix-turn-helix domain-containing protein [Alicyclobacillus sp.]
MSDVFGRRLRAYRKLKHWTQVDLAREIGVSVSIVGALERGTRMPDPSLLERLRTVLQVTDEELFGVSRNPDGSL